MKRNNSGLLAKSIFNRNRYNKNENVTHDNNSFAVDTKKSRPNKSTLKDSFRKTSSNNKIKNNRKKVNSAMIASTTTTPPESTTVTNKLIQNNERKSNNSRKRFSLGKRLKKATKNLTMVKENELSNSPTEMEKVSMLNDKSENLLPHKLPPTISTILDVNITTDSSSPSKKEDKDFLSATSPTAHSEIKSSSNIASPTNSGLRYESLMPSPSAIHVNINQNKIDYNGASDSCENNKKKKQRPKSANGFLFSTQQLAYSFFRRNRNRSSSMSSINQVSEVPDALSSKSPGNTNQQSEPILTYESFPDPNSEDFIDVVRWDLPDKISATEDAGGVLQMIEFDDIFVNGIRVN
ncbi:3069_t:CDS:2 [Ambispora leptoticha]|uniref:3069_t:CDS:1 n=1 Tax=Ambispora leptoticha TaxID=144679 RepID=A0A9N9AHT2_9GLOM|nr:3069_t:CDS:2 [Ambispora leptoticha]